jgi:prepilin-type N-terminal cleavage/methylation domain-containing protein
MTEQSVSVARERIRGSKAGARPVPAAVRATRGFTLIELIVVVTVIILVLAVAVPGLSALNAESRFTGAVQSVNGAITRAHFVALSDQNPVAVRFLPGEWDFQERSDRERPAGRQHIVTYRYNTSTIDPNDQKLEKVKFNERFERRKESESVILPEDVWIAPIEALWRDELEIRDNSAEPKQSKPNRKLKNVGAELVCNGMIGEFALDAYDGKRFLNQDDFLIVCDPRAGIRSGAPRPFRLNAYRYDRNPSNRYETDRDRSTGELYRRMNFSGVVVYRREGFVGLGAGAAGADRQEWLRRNGRPYVTHRFSGGLVPAARPGS